jgi:hypothetical protein
MRQGYKQTKIARGDTIYAPPTYPDGFYEDGVYFFGFWAIKVPSIRYVQSDHIIEINIEAKKSTKDEYPSVRSYEGGSVSTMPLLYIDTLTISTIDKGASTASTTNRIAYASSEIKPAIDAGKIDIDRYIDVGTSALKYFDWEDDDTWKKEKITIHLDRVAVENTSSYRRDVCSHIDHSSKNQDIEVSISLAGQPGGSFDQQPVDGGDTIRFTHIIEDYNAEKPKFDYTPRSVNMSYNAMLSEGLANHYIVFSEPQKLKKLQRGNFNIVIGETPVTGLTPDGLLSTHTQMAYASSNWDLEVSVDGGLTYSAFESEAVYTFGADANENFSDTNSILFHDEVLISDFDDTTIANSNNCYLGDIMFRYAPPELIWNNADRKDYYYKIMDNFEDKTD